MHHVEVAANACAAAPLPAWFRLPDNNGAAPIQVHIPLDTGCAAPAPVPWHQWPLVVQQGG